MEPNVNDHLKAYLENNEHAHEHANTNTPIVNPNIQNFGPNTREKVTEIQADSNYISIELHELPFGRFYAPGTRIQIRPLNTKELESFAIVNEKNSFDVKLKLNEVLKCCTKITFLDNKFSNYRDFKDGDRDTISIALSRISKKHGGKLEKQSKCNSCGNEEVKIEMIPANYIYKTENPKLTKWFDTDTSIYNFTLKTGAKISLGIPTIGLCEDTDAYILYKAAKSAGKDAPNITFMQCIPYMLAGRGIKTISIEKMEQEEFNFTKLNDDLFHFIYDTVDLIKFGIEEVKCQCPKCGEEVKSSYGFPNGARDLFMLSNAFDELIG